MTRSIREMADAPWVGHGDASVLMPDGSTLAVSGVDRDMGAPWFLGIKYNDGPVGTANSIRGLMVGPTGVTDNNVKYMLGGDYVGEYAADGGTVLIAKADDGSAGLVAWCGRWHEAWAGIPGDATHGEALKTFDGLRFKDTPRGLRIVLGPGKSWNAMTAIKEVPSVGDLIFERAGDRLDRLPTWSGARTRVGEVWRLDLKDLVGPGKSRLVMANNSVFATLCNESNEADDRGLSFLGRMTDVTWT